MVKVVFVCVVGFVVLVVIVLWGVVMVVFFVFWVILGDLVLVMLGLLV